MYPHHHLPRIHDISENAVNIGPGFSGANTKPNHCYFLLGLALIVCYVGSVYNGSLSASFV